MAAAAVLKLQKAGFTEPQVEALVEFMDSQAATKADAARLELRIDERTANLELTLEERTASLELKLEERTANLELKLGELRTEIEATKAELIKWVVGVGFAQVAMILAVLKLFPGGAVP